MIACLFLALPAAAQTADLTGLVNALGPGSFPQHEAAINALVATGDPRAVPVLQALSDGNLYVRKADSKVVFALKSGAGFALKDHLLHFIRQSLARCGCLESHVGACGFQPCGGIEHDREYLPYFTGAGKSPS